MKLLGWRGRSFGDWYASESGVIGILSLAYKLLVNDKAKFTALLVGITFAVFLMVQ